jgi:1,4-dihydroxy-2-naphthoate octaprenyltransferase
MSSTATVSTLWAFWQAARPRTWWCAFSPILLATALAIEAKCARGWVGVVNFLVALCLQMGADFFNDYADGVRGSDGPGRVGPARVTAMGWLSPAAVWWASVVSFGLAALIGLLAVWDAGWPLLVLGALSIAAGFAYTGGPYPLAYHGWGEIFAFLFFGLVAVNGSYFAYGHRLSMDALWLGCAMGSFAAGILVLNNLRDRHEDAVHGKRTIVVQYGARFGRVFYRVCLVLPYAIALGLALWRGKATMAGLLVPSLGSWLRLWRESWHEDGANLTVLLGATARLQALYACLLGIALVW